MQRPSPAEAAIPAVDGPSRAMADRRAARWTAAIAFALVMALTVQPDAITIASPVIPDGVEYAASAQRLATLGRFDISVGGAEFPSRYPISFGLLLTPAYLVAPGNFLAGMWVCRGIWAAGCAALAFALARRFGASIALCVVALLNVHPTVREHASAILSDMPSLGALLTIVAIRLPGRELGRREYAAAGVALAIGTACRTLAGAFALPLLIELRSARRPWSAAALLLVPSAAVLAINAIYNRLTFGAFDMNGYVYWCAVPYANLGYVFSIDYAVGQVPAIVADPAVSLPVLFAAIALAAVYATDKPTWRDAMRPMLLAALPMSVLYLFYCYGLRRLFLPLIVCACFCAGLAAVAALHRWTAGRWFVRLVCAALVGLTFFQTWTAARGEHPTDSLLRQMRAALPTRCSIITGIDAVTVAQVVTRGTDRRWVAVDRGQEYADKVVIDHRPSLAGIPPPPPFVHIWPQLLAQGARLAVPETAADDALLDRLADPAGPPVFSDAWTLAVHPTLRERLARRFATRSVAGAPDLVELVPIVPTTHPRAQPR